MSTSEDTEGDTALGFDEDDLDDLGADAAGEPEGFGPEHSVAALVALVAAGEVDFLDFGAGTGSSLAHYERVSGCRGAGVELAAHKVATAIAEGRAVFQGSIFDLPPDLGVRFVTADNVLEHLPTFDDVEAAIAAAQGTGADFLLIRHPSFEDVAYFHFHGLTPYWAAWTQHPSHVRLGDFAGMAHRLGVCSWEVHPVRRIPDSTAPELIPRTAGINQHEYDPEQHPPKDFHTFARACYAAYDIVFHFSPTKAVELTYTSDTETSMARPRLTVAPR